MTARLSVFAALALVCASAKAAALPAAPESPRCPTVDTLHGEKVADPYRWLEGSAAPELAKPDPALDRRVREWSLAQNARTRAYLDAQPGRDALATKLRTLFRSDSMSSPRTCGELDFFTRRRGEESHPVVFVRERATGAERELLNVNRLHPDGRTSLAEYSPSLEGDLVAFGTFRSGDENTTLRVLDTKTGKVLPDTLVNKAGDVSWLPGGKAFVYSRLRDINNPHSCEIRLHRIGEDPAKDRLIVEQPSTGPLATVGGPFAHVDRSGRHLVLGYHKGWGVNDLRVCDFQHWLATGELRGPVIAENSTASYSGVIRGDTLFLLTTEGAINGRLLKVDLRDARPESRRVIIPEPADRSLAGVSLAKDFLIVTWNENALTRFELRDLDGKRLRDLPQPGVGVASLACDETSNVAYLAFSSLNEPPSTYRVDLATGERTLYFRPNQPVSPADYEVKQLFYASKDGTRVPLFVAHRKGLRLDGDNPTILWGYGGFSVAQRPGFAASMIPWLDAGGVFAIAGLRGGDEYGEAWHRAGMLGNKQNVFDDFIGAAEFLIAQKYTSPARLGIRGGSNGGLLTGAALTQRPDLFAAVNVAVPLLDMLRYQHFLMARIWVPEYGDPSREADFRWLKAYSPYHNIRPGVKYPATLIEAGENDTRVHPLHARKMAARLQAETAGDPAKNPILLWVDFDSGHGAGKSFDMRVRDTSDLLLFFARNLGLDLAAGRRGKS